MRPLLDRVESAGSLSLDDVNPVAIALPLVLVGAALVLMSRRRAESSGIAAGAGHARPRSRRAARNSPRRFLLTMAITLLENDAARRGVILALKMVRNRL